MSDQAPNQSTDPVTLPTPPVQVVQVVPDSARISALERKAQDHDRMLKDHDEVLKALVQHLGQLITEVGRFKTRLTIAALVVFSGTQNGGQLLDAISKFLS